LIRKFLDNLKSYIEISNFERRGVFALLFSCILVVGYYFFKNSQTSQSVKYTEQELADYQALVDSTFKERVQRDTYRYKERYKTKTKDKVVYLPFNPNSDSEKQLLKAGIPPYVVNSLIKYRIKGGGFKQKSDFKKLYVVDEALYEVLKFHILLPEEVISDTDTRDSLKDRKAVFRVDINTASQEDLIVLKGIGEVFANRIINYRDLLGGFYDKGQMLEVYGLPEETYIAIEDYIFIETKSQKTIAINSATYEELAKHPYLSYKMAKSIVAYRNQHGNYLSDADLRKLHLLSEEDVDRVLPYLDLN
jgi:competence protein ComEA